MLELGTHSAWGEGLSSWLLEHDGDDVVANVTFPQQLQANSEVQVMLQQCVVLQLYN